MKEFAAIAAQFGDDPGGAETNLPILHQGPLWRWKAKRGETPAAWFFITIDGEAAARIKSSAARRGGFGSIKVEATIGATAFRTSLFPSNQPSGYLLPVKSAVRKAERLEEGVPVAVTLVVPN